MADNEIFAANRFAEKDYGGTVVTAEDVLGCLFNPEDTVNFRVFDDRKGGVFQGRSYPANAPNTGASMLS